MCQCIESWALMIEQQEVLIAGGIVGYLIEQIQLVTVVDDIVIVIPKIK